MLIIKNSVKRFFQSIFQTFEIFTDFFILTAFQALNPRYFHKYFGSGHFFGSKFLCSILFFLGGGGGGVTEK